MPPVIVQTAVADASMVNAIGLPLTPPVAAGV